MQAFEESATGETTVIKVWMLSQVKALGKVAQRGVGDGRTKVTAGGGVECVLAKRGGEESERSIVIVCHSLCFPVTVWEFGDYCAICAMYLVCASSFLNLMRVRRVVVVCSPSFEHFYMFNFSVPNVTYIVSGIREQKWEAFLCLQIRVNIRVATTRCVVIRGAPLNVKS
jgi:hypothetical protein